MKKEKLMKWCMMFFALMLVFTVLSRAADSVNIARVSVKTVQNQLITHTVTGTGKIEGTRETAVFAREGQRIGQVLVQEGQSVKKGETLLVLSAETLDDTILEKKDEIAELELKVHDLQTKQQEEEQKAADDLARAQEDYNLAVENGDINIANAQMEADVSRQKLQNYYNAVDRGMAADTSQEQALRDEIRSRDEALNQVVMARNQELLTAERALADAGRAHATDGSLENAGRELDRARTDLEKLTQIRSQGGEVKSPLDGVVKSIAVKTGAQTGQEAAVILYETAGELRMTGTIREEDLEYVGVGGKAYLKGSSGREVENASVQAIREDSEDESLRIVSIAVPENTLSIGESTEFRISVENGPFRTCVPLSALHEENSGPYIYILDVENTVLGEVNVARRLNVNVKEKNESLAALEGGGLSSSQKVIVESDREISDGSRVRLKES